MSNQGIVTHPLILRQVQVLRREHLTPRLLRITLGGPELGAFERDGLSLPAFTCPAFDDHIKLIFAADGDVQSVLPVQNEQGIDWVFSENLITRDYTPRRFDPLRGELDLEFVLHGQGPAAHWAQQAQIGDALWFVGPKSSTLLPQQTGQMVLLGDETALPAIARFLEERPLSVPLLATIIIEKEEARLPLPTLETDRLQWVLGSATDPELWEETVRSLDLRIEAEPYIFVAGEARTLLPVRRYLSRELGLKKHQLNITGYWHTRPETDATGKPLPAPQELPESPLAWFALRAALEVGLIQALASGPRPLQDLTHQLGLDAKGLLSLLETLADRNILILGEEDIALGEAGQTLLDDDRAAETFIGPQADQLLSMLQLGRQLTGNPATSWELTQGSSLRRQALTQPEVYQLLLERAEVLDFVGQAALEGSLWEDYDRVLVHGPAAVRVAQLFERQQIKPTLTLLEEGLGLELLKKEWAQERLSLAVDFQEAWSQAPVGISALTSYAMTDLELADHLRQAARYLPRLLVFVEEGTDQLIPRRAERDLLRYCLIGQSQRPEARVRQLALEAGFSHIKRQALGWGLAAYDLRR